MSTSVEKFNEEFHNQNGMCLRSELFRRILVAFPDAPVQMVIGDYAVGRIVQRLEVQVPGLGNDDVAYLSHANIWQLFPTIRWWGPMRRKGAIGVKEFIAEGDALARLLQREVTIAHRAGLSKHDKRGIKYHGPFKYNGST